jgi:hypothetical protein
MASCTLEEFKERWEENKKKHKKKGRALVAMKRLKKSFKFVHISPPSEAGVELYDVVTGCVLSDKGDKVREGALRPPSLEVDWFPALLDLYWWTSQAESIFADPRLGLCLVEVLGDGSCGFYVLKLFLSFLGEREDLWKPSGTKAIRKFIDDAISANSERYKHLAHLRGICQSTLENYLEVWGGCPLPNETDDWQKGCINEDSPLHDDGYEPLHRSTVRGKGVKGEIMLPQMSVECLYVFAELTGTRIICSSQTDDKFHHVTIDFRQNATDTGKNGTVAPDKHVGTKTGLPNAAKFDGDMYRTAVVVNSRLIKEMTFEEEKPEPKYYDKEFGPSHYSLWIPEGYNPRKVSSRKRKAQSNR